MPDKLLKGASTSPGRTTMALSRLGLTTVGYSSPEEHHQMLLWGQKDLEVGREGSVTGASVVPGWRPGRSPGPPGGLAAEVEGDRGAGKAGESSAGAPKAGGGSHRGGPTLRTGSTLSRGQGDEGQGAASGLSKSSAVGGDVGCSFSKKLEETRSCKHWLKIWTGKRRQPVTLPGSGSLQSC